MSFKFPLSIMIVHVTKQIHMTNFYSSKFSLPNALQVWSEFWRLMSLHRIKGKKPTNQAWILSMSMSIQIHSENLFSTNLYQARFRKLLRDTKITWKIHLVNFYINYSWFAGYPKQEKPWDALSRGILETIPSFSQCLKGDNNCTGFLHFYYKTRKPKSLDFQLKSQLWDFRQPTATIMLIASISFLCSRGFERIFI